MNRTKICKYCKTVIPKNAKFCPSCYNKQDSALKWVIIAVIMLIIITLPTEDKEEQNQNKPKTEHNTASSTDEITAEPKKEETKKEYKKTCKEYAYKDVLRNPQKYIGKRIKVTVQISSVHEPSLTNDTKYYFAYSEGKYGYWTGDRYGIFDKRSKEDMKLLEDDVITVYGEIADPEHTESLIINSSEVFCINMKYIDFISE